MASAVDAGRATTNITTAADPWTVNYPASIVAGNLLIGWARAASTAGFNPAGGWTHLIADSTDASDDNNQIMYKWADGTESGTFSLDLNASAKGSVIVWRITGAENPGTQLPEYSAVAIGTTTANTANPNSRSVTGGPKDMLYLALMGLDGELNAPSGAPTNYSNLATANSGTGGAVATNCSVGGASRQILASSSEDPGAFTHAAAANGWTAYTVAIHPAAVAAPGPARRRRPAHRFLTLR